jgi:hypothetical protein
MGLIQQPLLHFQTQNKDFLCVQNQEGSISVFGRNGDLRFKTPKCEGDFKIPLQADFGKQSPRIVAMNSKGKAYICNLEGKTFSLQVADQTNTKINFVFAPILGDERYDYVLSQGNGLKIAAYIGSDFKVVQNTSIPMFMDTLFNINMSNNTQQIGAINRAKQQIYLYDAHLKLHPDFPLAGTTPFTVSDVFQDGKSNILVVGNTFNLYAYKIN